MKQLFSAYPAGLAGLALLFLRCSLALFLAASTSEILDLQSWPLLILDGLAVALAAGFATRIIAATAAVAGGFALILGDCAMPVIVLSQVIDALAIALIGPGAYSIDARMFGRITITLPH
jgi:hypothetical protein